MGVNRLAIQPPAEHAGGRAFRPGEYRTVGRYPLEFLAIDTGTPPESTSARFELVLAPTDTEAPTLERARWNDRRGWLRVRGDGPAGAR